MVLKSLQTNGRMWTEIIRLQPPQVTENEERCWHSCNLFGDITVVSLIHCMLTSRNIALKMLLKKILKISRLMKVHNLLSSLFAFFTSISKRRSILSAGLQNICTHVRGEQLSSTRDVTANSIRKMVILVFCQISLNSEK